MADSEAEADRVIARAMGAISDVHPDGAAAGRFLARAPRARLRASQDRFAELRRGIALQLHRRAPRASADLPRRRSAQCLPEVVGPHGRLVVRGLRAGELHGPRARRAARRRRQGQAAESRADRAAHGARRARRQPHRHAARVRTFAAAGQHRQPHGPHQPARRRRSARATSWPSTRRSPSSWRISISSSASTTRMGHEAGDRALKLFADTARGVVRDRDHVVRWGGEEFALLLPGANAERAAEVVGRLRAALAQAHLLSGTPDLHGELRHLRLDDGARSRNADPARRRGAVPLEAGRTRLLHRRRSAAGFGRGASATRARWSTSRRWRE